MRADGFGQPPVMLHRTFAKKINGLFLTQSAASKPNFRCSQTWPSSLFHADRTAKGMAKEPGNRFPETLVPLYKRLK